MVIAGAAMPPGPEPAYADPPFDPRTLHPALLSMLVDRARWSDLRAIQELAFGPIAAGRDVLLLAPTAGGKTEAAALPLLQRLCEERERGAAVGGVRVLWVAPLRALVDDLAARLSPYAEHLGLRVVGWHGEMGASLREAAIDDPPDVVVTTPESVEGMFLARRDGLRVIDRLGVAAGLTAAVVDEVHAFAGTARGGQLLAQLQRLEMARGSPVQRIGLSATVGNPAEVLDWLASGRESTRQVISAPPKPRARRLGVARVATHRVAHEVAVLLKGAKTLVFVRSRNDAETLSVDLQQIGADIRPHHAGLSRTLRAEAENFIRSAPARSGSALVCTSTLELGVDIGDIDRVVQIGPPPSVGAMLQRMGRSGRRGQAPELIVLVETDAELREVEAMFERARRGDVEPAELGERHERLLAQQLLARAAAGEVGDGAVLVEALAAVPGLRGFAPREVDAARAELVASGRLRALEDGSLVLGDRAPPITALCSVFEEMRGTAVRDANGELVGEVRERDVGEDGRFLLGGRWWG